MRPRGVTWCRSASLVVATALALASGAAPARAASPENVFARALSTHPADADAAVAELRALGEPALRDLLRVKEQLAAELPKLVEEAPRAALAARLAQLDAVIDRVGGQLYCSRSGLFWHTDFDKAKETALRLKRPILSLRMLGNLTDELSCANSRFFRSTLYANAEVSAYLRDNFVLHWRSVRPVPKITIDFGDGRTMVRTLTGNSAHYVLTADGQPVDVLPGLYAPRPFVRGLEWARVLAIQCQRLNPAGRLALLRSEHATAARMVLGEWELDLRRIGVAPRVPTPPRDQVGPPRQAAAAPAAEVAAAIARPKALIETPVIRAVTLTPEALTSATGEEQWAALAKLHESDVRFDDASLALIRSENPTARAASALAITKRKVEDPLERLVANLRASVALDTVRNEYDLHRRAHEWFVAGDVGAVDALNQRVYAELFLTPDSDPWLGLLPGDNYTALKNAGVVQD